MLVIGSINVYTDVLSVSISPLSTTHGEMKVCLTEFWLLLPDGSVSDGIRTTEIVNNISLSSIIF